MKWPGSGGIANNIVEITAVLYLGFVPRLFPQPRRLRLGIETVVDSPFLLFRLL
jgi:hypothetical protein